jgi:hypothetical protein
MGISETLRSLRELAATVPTGSYDRLEDMAEAEYLLLTCKPALSSAAIARCMSLFIHLREKAVTDAA